jgi:CheY-like chemotaxis protein
VKKTKFFIVDDDEFAARVHAKALEAAGYTATIETDSERALPRIQSERPDVVLLDILMPGIDGLEICRDLRSSKEFDDTKIVFVSAKSYEFDRKRVYPVSAYGTDLRL